MKRQSIKTINNGEIEFVPSKYKDMDRKAESIYERPLIFMVKRLKREQRYELEALTSIRFNVDRESIDVKNLKAGEVTILGQGDATKYIWDNCVSKALNVIINENGEDKSYEVYDNCKDLWNSFGLDDDISETVKFIIDQSKLTEEEAKN